MLGVKYMADDDGPGSLSSDTHDELLEAARNSAKSAVRVAAIAVAEK